jgi:hypothetical protein
MPDRVADRLDSWETVVVGSIYTHSLLDQAFATSAVVVVSSGLDSALIESGWLAPGLGIGVVFGIEGPGHGCCGFSGGSTAGSGTCGCPCMRRVAAQYCALLPGEAER